MDEYSKPLGKEMAKMYRLITDAFTKTSLRRGITTKNQIASLKSLQSKIRSILNSKTVVNNLSTKEFLELQNYTTDYLNDYVNQKIEKVKIKEGFKTKANIIKKNVPAISEVAKKTINIPPKSTVTTLIDSLGGFTQKKSTSTAVTPYDAVKAQGNKVNFNLRGYQLFENAAYNAKIHGVSKTIEELDIGVKEGKINASEADNMKKTFAKESVKSKLSQFGEQGEVKQFNRPEYQKAFKTFLKGTYNTFTKMGKVVGKVAPKVFLPLQVMDMKKQYDNIMEQSKKPVEPLVYRTGGKVKRKPYAMGGKVYSNQTRKPKFK